MLTGLVVALAIHIAAEETFRTDEIIFPQEPMHNHSSSIVETADGDLLACWFHGRGEKGDDTLVIQGARKRKGEQAWSAPFVMIDNPDLPDQNPVMFIDPRGTLWLWWISSLDNTSATYMLKYVTSTDYAGDGPPKWTWQDVMICRPAEIGPTLEARIAEFEQKNPAAIQADPGLKEDIDEMKKRMGDKLSQRLGWMTRQQPIVLSDSKMVLGLYSDTFGCSLASWTEDWGRTWKYGQPMLLSSPGNVQPAFVQKKNGDLVAFMRENGMTDKVRRAVSADGGVTWAEAPLDIPNPGSSVERIALKSGSWILVGNDTTGGPRNGRTQLAAFLSDDEGATWKWKRHLEMHDAKTAAAYPFLIQSRDGAILCSYTHTPEPDETIKVVRFNEAWVREGGER